MWIRRHLTLAARPRGVHLVTDEVVAAVPEIGRVAVGLLHVFIRHTSASLTLNEAASPEVRGDLERWMRRAAPDGAPYMRHTLEGPDDMPAHVKASLFGAAVTVPVEEGRLVLGTWQGLHLCEHRVDGGARRLVATLWGETGPPGQPSGGA